MKAVGRKLQRFPVETLLATSLEVRLAGLDFKSFSTESHRLCGILFSAQQRQDPNRATGAAFEFGWSDYGHCARHRCAIKVGDVFQLVDAVRQGVLAHREVFRPTVVDAEGINAEAQGAASVNQKLR